MTVLTKSRPDSLQGSSTKTSVQSSSRTQSPSGLRPARPVQYPWLYTKERSRRNSRTRNPKNDSATAMPWESSDDMSLASPNKVHLMQETLDDLQIYALGLRQEYCDVVSGVKNVRDINLDNTLRIAEGHAAEISKVGIKLSQMMQEVGMGSETTRRQLRSYCNWVAFYINPDTDPKKRRFVIFPASTTFRHQWRANQVQVYLQRLAEALTDVQNQFKKLEQGVQWPPRPQTYIGTDARYCIHRLATMCELTSGPCCACSDKRPFKDASELYVDGRKTVMDTGRWKHYCPSCTAYWNVQSKTRQKARHIVYNNGNHKECRSSRRSSMTRASRGKSALSFIGPTGSRRACIVCDEYRSDMEFPAQITSNCQHEVNTCSSCVQQWIHACVSSHTLEKIGCIQCSLPLQYSEIRMLASVVDFEMFDALTLRHHHSSLSTFFWCLNPACSSGQIHDVSEKDNGLFVCNSCGIRSCTNHGTLWHDGMNCEDFDDCKGAKALKRPNEKPLDNTTQLCPNEGCGAAIEKYEGCEKMTCKSCNYEFCWICHANYEEIRKYGNGRHRVSCDYYRGRSRSPLKRDMSSYSTYSLNPASPLSNQNSRHNSYNNTYI